jgi:fructose-bisphosphate aldolase class II
VLFEYLTHCSYNIEQLTALVRAAEAKRSPLIIQLFPSTLKQLPTLAHAAAAAVKTASVPLSLHIDHAQNVEQIREIIATLPVDSVMVDMSHYDEEENLEKTKILAKECHEKGIAVEAESGRIEGGEDGIADTGDLEGSSGHWMSIYVATFSDNAQHSLRHHKTSIISSLPMSTFSLPQ